MGENLNLMQALYVTISSMAMVFLILLVISGILSLFKYIFKNENNIKKPNANNTCRDFVNNNSVEDNFEIDEEVITVRPADLIEPEFEKMKMEAGSLAKNDEDVLAVALFPQVAPKFLENKYNKKKVTIEDNNKIKFINVTM